MVIPGIAGNGIFGFLRNHGLESLLVVFGYGEQVRDFVYVADCARANLLALEKGGGRVFNLASGVGTSVNQIFEALKAITGYPDDAQYAPAKPGETFRIFLDAARAQQELGWRQTLDLTAGLQQTVEYFRQVELQAPGG